VLLKNVAILGLHWGAYFQNEQEAIPGVWFLYFPQGLWLGVGRDL
jgi:hypothetical protein